MLTGIAGVLGTAALFVLFGLLWRGRAGGCDAAGGCPGCGGDPDRRECGHGRR